MGTIESELRAWQAVSDSLRPSRRVRWYRRMWLADYDSSDRWVRLTREADYWIKRNQNSRWRWPVTLVCAGLVIGYTGVCLARTLAMVVVLATIPGRDRSAERDPYDPQDDGAVMDEVLAYRTLCLETLGRTTPTVGGGHVAG